MSESLHFENQIFTIHELYQNLGFSTYPTDRELEAKIIMFLRKYNNVSGENSDRLFRFFSAVYDFFFDNHPNLKEDDEDEDDATLQEGMTMQTTSTDTIQGTQVLNPVPASMAPPTIVNSVAYSGDVMNPILKQTIQRIIVVDSTYRNLNATNARLNPLSTNFTIELSEPLRDVLCLKLYSYTIPYSWYTINKDTGSNYFILKGISPGLSDTATYNFKISIIPGNYDAISLTKAINDSFSEILKLRSDVQFGTPLLEYNIINTLATFNINIQNLYHEYSYQLYWPQWNSLSSDIDRKEKGKSNIPAYLGFDSPTYDLQTVYSQRNSLSTASNSDKNESLFYVNDRNNFFQIIHYAPTPLQDGNGSFYIPEYNDTPTTEIDRFTISLSLIPNTSYSRQDIQTDLTNQLKAAVFLQSSVANLERINQTDGSHSFYKMNLAWNRSKVKIQPHSKSVVVFPDESFVTTDFPAKQALWTGVNSCFRFHSWNDKNPLQMELNNVYAEKPLYATTYSIVIPPFMKLVCHVPGYDLPTNDVTVPIKTNPLYNIAEYIDAINDGLRNHTVANGYFNFPQTKFSLDKISTVPNLELDYNVTFTRYLLSFSNLTVNTDLLEYYKVNPQGQLDSTVNLVSNSYSKSFVLSNISSAETYSIPFTPFILLTVDPDTGTNCNFPFQVPFVFSSTKNSPDTEEIIIDNRMQIFQYSSFEAFFNAYTDSIRGFSDSNNSLPFNGSTFNWEKYLDIRTGQNKIKITMTLQIQKTLTQHDFTLQLYDLSSDLVQINDSTSSWSKYLNFDPSYDLSLYNGNPSLLVASKGIDDEILTLEDSVNNIFSFLPLSSSDGLTTAIAHPTYTGQYYNDLRITVPCNIDSNGNTISTPCNNLVLFRKMNAAFSSNEVTRGTSVSFVTSPDDKKEYCKMRVNVNQFFTAKDYVLNFYDVDILECPVGNNSIRNTTWDTTLGWLLGFRNQTTYALSLPVEPSSIDPGIPGIAHLTGETSVNTNLYSYLLISVDDFNQNRLNDGVVTIAKTDSRVPLPSYSSQSNFFCYDKNLVTNGSILSGQNNLTGNQVYALNEVLKTQKAVISSSIMSGENPFTGYQYYAYNEVLKSKKAVTKLSPGPFLKDVFAVIPFKVPSNPGDPITEFGGSLQNQNRFYFGPVNVRRLQVQLYTDKGNILDLNNKDWTFKFIVEQLYQKQGVRASL